MMKRTWFILLTLIAVAGLSSSAAAQLTVIGTAAYNGSEYNLIYEEDQGLVWLDYERPSDPWNQQVEWAAGLNAPGVLDYNLKPGISVSWEGDWRLPKAVDGPHRNGYDGTTTAGFNITTSEMGHLYYKSLGNLGYYDENGNARPGWGLSEEEYDWGLKNTGPFVHLTDSSHWSGTEYKIASNRAWDFNMYFGSQNNHSFKSSYWYPAMAVRPARVTER